MVTRRCFREPIPEVAEAAKLLDGAVSAHLSGDFCTAKELIRLADRPVIRAWTESIWGAKSHTGTVYDDVLAIWRSYAAELSGGPIDCGHYVPEEAPEATLERLLEHFSNEIGSTR